MCEQIVSRASSACQTNQMKLSIETVEALSNLKSEPNWTREFRRRAWEIFEKIEIPKLDEEWVRIDLSNFSFESITPSINYPFSPDQLPEIKEIKEWMEVLDPSRQSGQSGREESGILAQVGSAASEIYLNAELAKKGVIFTDLDTASQKHPELVQRYFMNDSVRVGESKFTALHGALWSGGSFLYVPKGIEVELPMHSYFWMNGAGGNGIFPHTLIVLEENSRLVYIDEYSSPSHPSPDGNGGYALSDAIVEIFLKKGAQLSYFNVQRWGNNVYHFLKQRVISDADSQLTSVSVALGSKLTKSNIETMLRGVGASAQMLGILMGDLNQFFAHNTLQDHICPNAASDLLFKAALKDKAHSVFSGLIRVAKDAQKTNAYQANRNLLLSDGARATPIPRLEIEANEVRCTHGATVGPVDEEQIYYLMTRGLDHKTAQRMIVLGFFDQVLQRIPIESAKQRLVEQIEEKLEGLTEV